MRARADRIFLTIWLPLAFLACSVPASGNAEESEGDWCSSVVVRPDRRWQSIKPCVRAWSDGEVAIEADIVLLGSYQDVTVSEDRSVNPQCGGPFTHENNAAYISALKALRPEGDEPTLFVHRSRFDLVSPSHAEADGFQASFLVKTKTLISKVEDFFRSDHSSRCRGKCRWMLRRPGGPEWTEMGLDGAINAAGPGPTHEEVVYYVSLRNFLKQSFSPHAVLADLTNAGYRKWRVERARRALEEGRYDAVMLNHKFDQYYKGKGFWLGSSSCPDVTSCTGKPGNIFSAEPDGYGFSDYVEGWVALAKDLKSADVPFVIRLNPNPWLTRSDDPSTPEIDEAAQIRSVLSSALFVIVDAANTGWGLSMSHWTKQLSLSGVRVVPVDSRCGYAKPVSF